jgi:undecaprenyl diphosphate synthase
MTTTTQHYTEEQLSVLDFTRIPKHVAIIPDGNRRWAKQNLSNQEFGHKEGAGIVINIVEAAKEIGIQTLTIYTFSTENWQRPQMEVDALMDLLTQFLKNERSRMVENGVKLNTIGDIEPFPPSVIKELKLTQEVTRNNTDIDLVLALNYGSKDELARAFKTLLLDIQKGKVAPDTISSQTVTGYLDTAKWSDPELLIRTGGEHRISNFLLLQLAYAELYMTPILWPDFCHEKLLLAIKSYQERERRFGT